jgi:integrase/recombinase XerD
MAQAKTLTPAEIEQLLSHINTRKYAARNRSMMLLTHWAGLRIGEVAGLRWSDVTATDGLVKDEIRLLPDMTKGRHARTVFVSAKLKAELQAFAAQAKFVHPPGLRLGISKLGPHPLHPGRKPLGHLWPDTRQNR